MNKSESKHDADLRWMNRAIELAAKATGHAAPNPLVGCVIVKDGGLIAEGWHVRCGSDHAEAMALKAAGSRAAGSTAYVNLEPCAHHGRTPPCANALVDAGVARVVVANLDPFEKVAGQGIAKLESAGITVDSGLLALEARRLNRAYFQRVETGRPWVIAKWAMSLDGRIATSTGDSKWISNEHSRGIVHQIRGQVDAVIVGIGTALADNPMLNARDLTGEIPRVATRVVIDSTARLSFESKLVKTAADIPVVVATAPDASEVSIALLRSAGIDVHCCESRDRNDRLAELLQELGSRGMTRVLVEGGGQLLGSLNDRQLIDEVNVFVAPKIIGGTDAMSPVGGTGLQLMSAVSNIDIEEVRDVGGDIYLRGVVRR